MQLWVAQLRRMSENTTATTDACTGCTDSCALLPPADSSFPCYQGSPKDAKFCFNTDPLLKEGTTYSCGVCTDFGYTNYLQNDPIYKKMELWNSPRADVLESDASNACLNCATSCGKSLPY